VDLISKILSFKDLPVGFDSYESNPPNDVAIKNAIEAVNIFTKNNFLPDLVVASSEEGVIMEFFRIDYMYYLFEFYNDGDIIFLERGSDNKSEAEEIKIKDIEKKILKIKTGGSYA